VIGMDMTRLEVQKELQKQGRPWEIGKTLEHSVPIWPISPVVDVPDMGSVASAIGIKGAARAPASALARAF
jgi:fumarylpyruvate hydrolase